jgi:hypothetical protein
VLGIPPIVAAYVLGGAIVPRPVVLSAIGGTPSSRTTPAPPAMTSTFTMVTTTEPPTTVVRPAERRTLDTRATVPEAPTTAPDAYLPPAAPDRTLDATCAAILASLPVAPAPGWTVICETWRPNLAAQTDPSTSTITIFVAAGDDDLWLRRALVHEIGHSYDLSVLTWAERERWQQERGFAEPWFPTCACSDLGYGAGDFAESYMFTFLPAASSYFASRLAPPPTLAQQDLLRTMVA